MAIEIIARPYTNWEGKVEGFEVVRPTHFYRDGEASRYSDMVVYRVRIREMNGKFVVEESNGNRLRDTFSLVSIKNKRKNAVKEAKRATRAVARKTLEMLTPIIKAASLRD